MNRLRLLALAAAALVLAGCGAGPAMSAAAPASAGPPATEVAAAPSASTDQQTGSPTSGAPGRAAAWWAWPAGATTCGAPALYRIGGGQPVRIGNCAAMLLMTPAPVEVRVGQEIDLHMTTGTPDAPGLAASLYPLPASPNDAILHAVAQADDGATGRFMAIAPGDVVLATTGLCTDPESGRQTNGACPVLAVTVTP
jgi:hypothetical protein